MCQQCPKQEVWRPLSPSGTGVWRKRVAVTVFGSGARLMIDVTLVNLFISLSLDFLTFK